MVRVRVLAAFVTVLRNPLNLKASAAGDFLLEPFPWNVGNSQMLNV